MVSWGSYEGKINIITNEDVGKWNIEFIAIRNNSGYEAITYINSSKANNKTLEDGGIDVLRSSDVDDDNLINIKDLAEVVKQYNMKSIDENWIENCDVKY